MKKICVWCKRIIGHDYTKPYQEQEDTICNDCLPTLLELGEILLEKRKQTKEDA